MPLFTPDRDLLNIHFEGYKLSSDSLTSIRSKHGVPVRVAKLRDDELSYQHVRTYTLHNHLFQDPSNPRTVYWCNNKDSITKATVCEGSILTDNVFSFPNLGGVEHRTNFSMCFLSKTLVIACAGNAEISLFKRDTCDFEENERSDVSEKWRLLTTATVGSSGHPVLVVTARLGDTGKSMDVLCEELSFAAKETTEMHDKTLMSYKWVRIVEDGAEKFSSRTLCELHSCSRALYATFQLEESNNRMQLLFMSEAEPKTTSSHVVDKVTTNSESKLAPSSKPSHKAASAESDIQEECESRSSSEKSQPEGKEEEVEAEDRHYGLGYKQDEEEGEVYTWDQSDEDVVVSFKLAEDVVKRDVCVRIEPPEIVVGLTDGSSLLRGDLCHGVDQEGCTWTLEKNILEVTLAKKAEGLHWKYLLKDKSLGGEMASVTFTGGMAEMSEEEKTRLKQLLKGLDEKDGVASGEGAGPAATVQGMLEECDRCEEDPLMFVVTEEGRLEAKVHVGGHQVLFVGPSPGGAGQPALFALRHDVDAVLWLPRDHASSGPSHPRRWKHCSTLNALGYIQASKRDRKFTTCSPDFSCAVMCDCTRHVFVYFQPDKKTTTAAEYVHTFLDPTSILGVAASSSKTMYVLTDNELCVLTRTSCQNSSGH